MRNPYLWGRPPAIVSAQVQWDGRRPVRSLLLQAGLNTGNFLFIHALRRAIGRQDGVPGQQFKFDPQQIGETHDGILIPAANWLNGHADFGELAAGIEASGLPCVIVGLGAQSRSRKNYPRLPEGTQRLLHVIAERSHSISVRGEYSADMLASYGVKNVTVTGCPSLLGPVRIFV